MKAAWFKAGAYSQKEAAFSLSSAEFCELLSAVLRRGSAFRFKARGMSMQPLILDGDCLTITPFSQNRKPRVGDVAAVVNQESESLLVHRIIRLTAEGYRIKGDNLQIADGDFPPGSLLGFVSCLERGARQIVMKTGIKHRLVAIISDLGLMPGIVGRICARVLFKSHGRI